MHAWTATVRRLPPEAPFCRRQTGREIFGRNKTVRSRLITRGGRRVEHTAPRMANLLFPAKVTSYRRKPPIMGQPRMECQQFFNYRWLFSEIH